MPNYYKVASLILLSILVSSCGHWQQQKLDSPQWQVGGKLVIKEPDQKAVSVQFTWQQQDDHYLIHIINPLGQVLMRLSGNDNQAQLIDHEGNEYNAASAEALLAKFSSWRLPISHLRYWVHGQLLGDESNTQFNTQNQPIAATKEPWNISWKYSVGIINPKKISLNHITQQQKIIVIVKSYERL